MLVIGYAIVAIVSGYAHARGCYNRESWMAGGIPGQNLGWALLVWIVYGLTWPFWAVLFVLFAAQYAIPVALRWLFTVGR